MTRVRVSAERRYDVHVGVRWQQELNSLIHGRKVVIITSQAQGDLVGEISSMSGDLHHCVIKDGEEGKSAESLLQIIDFLGEKNITRSDLVVGIGGGATTDIAGFAAATWLRGIDWVAIPTTIAGAVDAAIGGKTAANTRHGKNLFGAFYSPISVIVDFSWFESLSDRDFAAGLAEVIKCGFIKDPSILTLLEGQNITSIRGDRSLLEYLILKAVSVKASVVSHDFRENGLREILNYGHTLGHAIERASGYSMRHGECVSIGLVFAAELAHARGLIDSTLVERHRNLLSALSLPTAYQRSKWDELLGLMARDKKARGEVKRFVLLNGLAQPILVKDISSDELISVYERVSS